MIWDVFISHASEDKEDLVRPLAEALCKCNIKVWYDEVSISAGDSIIEKIMEGLESSKIGLLILSKHFFAKNWTGLELGIINFQKKAKNIKLIPVYHQISNAQISKLLPFLGDIKALDTKIGIDELVKAIINILEKEKVYVNLHNQSIESIGVFLKSINSLTSKIIGKQILKFHEIANIDNDMAIIRANIVVKTILSSILKRELEIEKFNEELKLIPHINLNIGEHLSLINRLSNIALRNNLNEEITSDDNLNLVKLSLKSILNWYYNCFFINIPFNERNIYVIPRGEIVKEDFEESYRIEKLVLPNDLISPVDEVVSWYKHNSYTMHGVRDTITGKLIGFINALPLTDQMYNLIEKGQTLDTIIPITMIKKYDYPDFYKLYISSICISPEYQDSNAFKILYDSFIEEILNIAILKEIFISEILADASTPQGERLCNAIRMTFITSTNHNSKIYRGILIPPSLRLRNLMGQRLTQLYNKKFDEFKEFFS